jgi:metal-dependent amidase/aminoacylase/carboxypeptidase family protein
MLTLYLDKFYVENKYKYKYIFNIWVLDIKKVAKTGIVIDIKGTGPESNDGKCECIAFRADMDALVMEETTGLEYTSTWLH